jgi:hypothetical protein
MAACHRGSRVGNVPGSAPKESSRGLDRLRAATGRYLGRQRLRTRTAAIIASQPGALSAPPPLIFQAHRMEFKTKTLSTKLAYGCFGAGLGSLLGPSFFAAMDPSMTPAEAAFQSVSIGVVLACTAMALAPFTLRRIENDEDKSGEIWAKAGFVLGAIGGVFWFVYLLVHVVNS